MLIAQPSVNALGRVALFLDTGFVLFEDLIDDRNCLLYTSDAADD